MQLGVQDAARLLAVPEKTIYRWIKQGEIPAHKINDQYRFNRAELLEWATARNMQISPEIFGDHSPSGAGLPTLLGALRVGGVHDKIGGSDKQAVMRSVVDSIILPPEVDRDFLCQVLLAREALGSTGVGDGIAIPHVRNPIVLHLGAPMIALCYLEKPIDFGALDGQAVNTLFILISPSVRAHLHMLSRLGYVLRDARFKATVKRQSAGEELFAELERAESALTKTPADSNASPSQSKSD